MEEWAASGAVAAGDGGDGGGGGKKAEGASAALPPERPRSKTSSGAILNEEEEAAALAPRSAAETARRTWNSSSLLPPSPDRAAAGEDDDDEELVEAGEEEQDAEEEPDAALKTSPRVRGALCRSSHLRPEVLSSTAASSGQEPGAGKGGTEEGGGGGGGRDRGGGLSPGAMRAKGGRGAFTVVAFAFFLLREGPEELVVEGTSTSRSRCVPSFEAAEAEAEAEAPEEPSLASCLPTATTSSSSSSSSSSFSSSRRPSSSLSPPPRSSGTRCATTAVRSAPNQEAGHAQTQASSSPEGPGRTDRVFFVCFARGRGERRRRSERGIDHLSLCSRVFSLACRLFSTYRIETAGPL